ncbi:rab3 GTPase-activating protein non-catalytic subunit-like [Pollicipes pollicipes]|uniref:rab3 GTPase-activating protein non-catalytic subunit-like n=1 Tax=Pollicipes pollicipes TaxID=41117 RepID=UPI0018855961|nr:rab3 GTPase-activating protein non-catalytic subunit-like [Pollicipes pollicipes]
MALSRDRRLSAVTDSFGRVTLVDNHGGAALGMWKGYRDAECGWLDVREPRPAEQRRPRRRARFLALYARRRGLLEVWAVVGGPKVAAFSVSKHGRLVNVAHGLMGLSESDGAEPSRRASQLLQTVFLSADGRLLTLNVPFHLALSERSSRRAHGQKPASLDHDSQVLLHTALAYKRLLAAYVAAEADRMDTEDTEVSQEELCGLLRLSPAEASALVARRVTFAERRPGPAEFLRCLEVTTTHGQAAVSLRPGITEEETAELGYISSVLLTSPSPPDWRGSCPVGGERRRPFGLS